MDFAPLIGDVARLLWGEPNASLSRGDELRYGSRGARLVRVDKGAWADNEVGESGGVIDLIRREMGCDARGAFDWLVEQGLAQDDKSSSGPTAGRSTNGAAKPPTNAEGGRGAREATASAESAPSAPPQDRKIVRTYDYTDATGELLYQVVRWEPKTFNQRRKFPGRDGWLWSLHAGEFMRAGPGRDWTKFDQKKWDKWAGETWARARERATVETGVEHGLYQLLELREGGVETVVWLPEGEKDVEALQALGLTATTNSGGAGNWGEAHAQALAGRDVVVLVDNDDAGRKRGSKLASTLRGVAKRVRVLDLSKHWPGMPEKADVSDWLAQGGTADQLTVLADGTDPWEPEPYQSKFGALWYWQLDRDDRPQHSWLVDDWVTEGEKVLIYGASQSGKSFLAMHIAFCVARGVPFFDHKVMMPGGVVYQAGEGSAGVPKRVLAYRIHNNLDPYERMPFVMLRSPVNIWSKDGDTPALIEEIKALSAMMPVPLRLVVVDTLSTATAGADENSGRDMSAVMDHVDQIRRECKCAVALVHHKNAAGERPRGHSSIFANIDGAIEVTVDKDSKIRTAKNTKQKDAEQAAAIRFELLSVQVGRRASDGKAITSCVCLPAGEKEAAKAEQRKIYDPSNTEAIFFKALLSALRRHGEPPPMFDLGCNATVVVDYARVKERYKALVPPDGDDDVKKHAERLKKNLQRARERLFRFGVIDANNPYIWWTGKPVRGFARSLPSAAPQVSDDDSLPSEVSE